MMQTAYDDNQDDTKASDSNHDNANSLWWCKQPMTITMAYDDNYDEAYNL